LGKAWCLQGKTGEFLPQSVKKVKTKNDLPPKSGVGLLRWVDENKQTYISVDGKWKPLKAADANNPPKKNKRREAILAQKEKEVEK